MERKEFEKWSLLKEVKELCKKKKRETTIEKQRKILTFICFTCKKII
jgi:hypothetical protein